MKQIVSLLLLITTLFCTASCRNAEPQFSGVNASKWVQRTKDANKLTRESAWIALIEIAKQDDRFLREAIEYAVKSSDTGPANEALSYMVNQADLKPWHEDALIDAINHENAEVRINALWTFGEHPESTKSQWSEILKRYENTTVSEYEMFMYAVVVTSEDPSYAARLYSSLLESTDETIIQSSSTFASQLGCEALICLPQLIENYRKYPIEERLLPIHQVMESCPDARAYIRPLYSKSDPILHILASKLEEEFL